MIKLVLLSIWRKKCKFLAFLRKNSSIWRNFHGRGCNGTPKIHCKNPLQKTFAKILCKILCRILCKIRLVKFVNLTNFFVEMTETDFQRFLQRFLQRFFVWRKNRLFSRNFCQIDGSVSFICSKMLFLTYQEAFKPVNFTKFSSSLELSIQNFSVIHQFFSMLTHFRRTLLKNPHFFRNSSILAIWQIFVDLLGSSKIHIFHSWKTLLFREVISLFAVAGRNLGTLVELIFQKFSYCF